MEKQHVKRTFSTKNYLNESKCDFLTRFSKTCSNRNFVIMFMKTDDNNNSYFSRHDIEQNPTYISKHM